MLHNHHFLSFASMMQGQGAESLLAAREMIAGIPEDWAKSNAATVDGYMAIALEALMRFGKWDDILAEPQPPAHFPVTTALWRFSRAIAYGAKGLAEMGRREQGLFHAAVNRVPEGAMMAINPAADVLKVAARMLEGELSYREGNLDDALKGLEEAVALEDALRYMEPPDWIQPVRHTLGAVLLREGRVADAEKVYRKDLEVWPDNGWSLFGLYRCLEARRAKEEAAAVKARFDRVWADADVELASTCLCVPG
jgi:tetratricopeptide (TPR) repeat protein